MASGVGAPGGPNFGDVPYNRPDTLPEYEGAPVMAQFVLGQDEEPRWYGAVAGTPYVVNRRFTPLTFRQWATARDHVRGAPLTVRILYSATWALLDLPPQAHQKGRRKSWDQLGEGTKRGYRGPMRKLGLKTEAEFGAYYADAPNLDVLRRHVKPTFMSPVGQVGFSRGSGKAWLVTWQR